MKPVVLAASLATVAVTSAAELKDPSTIALEWEKAVAAAPTIQVPANLRAQVQTPPIFPEDSFQQTPLWNPQAQKPDPSPFGDGIIRPPGYDKDKPARGAKPYKSKDGAYWLIPITS